MKPGSESAREGMSSSFQGNAVVTGCVWAGQRRGHVCSAAGWCTELVHCTSPGGPFHTDFHRGQGLRAGRVVVDPSGIASHLQLRLVWDNVPDNLEPRLPIL